MAEISAATSASAAISAGLALRVAVEPGVLDGHADVRGERRQEPLIGLAEAAAARSCSGR